MKYGTNHPPPMSEQAIELLKIRLCKSTESVKKQLTKRAIDRRDWRRLSLLTSSASCLLEAWTNVPKKVIVAWEMRERIEQQFNLKSELTHCRLASEWEQANKSLAPKMFNVVNMIWDESMTCFILPFSLSLDSLFVKLFSTTVLCVSLHFSFPFSRLSFTFHFSLHA